MQNVHDSISHDDSFEVIDGEPSREADTTLSWAEYLLAPVSINIVRVSHVIMTGNYIV